jgi:hypothetical protein
VPTPPPHYPAPNGFGLTIRQAGIVTALVMATMTPVTPFAEYYAMPKLVVRGDAAATVHNLSVHPHLFFAAIAAYTLNYLADLVLAWSVYYLLRPAQPAVSLLAALFRVVYTAIGFVSVSKLLAVYHLMADPASVGAAGSLWQDQIALLTGWFRWDWSLNLIVFSFFLCLEGWLVFRSGYIPRVLGVILFLNGLAWFANSLKFYLYPTLNLGFLGIFFFGEIVLMIWLLVKSWSLPDRLSAAA